MTICNMCGESCDLKNFKDDSVMDEGGLIDCKVSGGYSSTAGNGYGALDDSTSYRFSLCEFCVDWLFQQFKTPPQTSDYMLGGINDEEPFRPAAERVKEDDWRKMKEGFFKEYNRRAELRKK